MVKRWWALGLVSPGLVASHSSAQHMQSHASRTAHVWHSRQARGTSVRVRT